MNLILLNAEQMVNESYARLNERQTSHLHKTLKSKIGDTLKVGLINADMGFARIESLNTNSAEVSIEWQEPPPKALPLKLIVALPRPKMLKRIIQTAVTMGVKDITFLNAWKVEKSFWQSPWLTEEKLYENTILGLEQAKDTQLPRLQLKPLFKPFVEDELAEYANNTKRLLAHPGASLECPHAIGEACTLIIGPEGGFTPYEVGKLEEQDFTAVHLGPRILKVETAVPSLIARLYC